MAEFAENDEVSKIKMTQHMICMHFIPSLAKIGLYEISLLRNIGRRF